ncbi:MAG: hypothetical protein EPO57_08910, partial [Chitinophagaceae bacterium]
MATGARAGLRRLAARRAARPRCGQRRAHDDRPRGDRRLRDRRDLRAGCAAGPRLVDVTEVRRLLGRLPASAPQAGDLVELVESARLRGRGGAAFPVARKLRTAQQARGRPVVVVNAAEGEPASSKDRTLLATDPALVVEGARAVARALRAVEVVVAAHDPRLVSGLGVRVVELQPGYVRSEASAVVSAVTGGRGLPTARRRPQAERGPGGRPWVVQNVETFG